MIKIISLGGSIVSPDNPDVNFIKDFCKTVAEYLEQDSSNKLIFVVGGGGPARTYQNAAKSINSDIDAEDLDWIGIMATRLNAQLIKACLSKYCFNDVVIDPTEDFFFNGRVLVAAGWKPGFSTDTDAVYLAEKFKAKTVINLSNIAKVYTADPKLDKTATPIDVISWDDFKKIVGCEWTPGKNLPFDPIATKKAAKLQLEVICAAGKDIKNFKKILNNSSFIGTTIC